MFRTQGTLKVGFLSNLQVAGWLVWEPSLLMSIYNVRLTRVRVKDKACIYNDLRITAGIGRIAGMRLHYRGRIGAIAELGVDERYGDVTPVRATN
jgi:hypothetical protein